MQCRAKSTFPKKKNANKTCKRKMHGKRMRVQNNENQNVPGTSINGRKWKVYFVPLIFASSFKSLCYTLKAWGFSWNGTRRWFTGVRLWPWTFFYRCDEPHGRTKLKYLIIVQKNVLKHPRNRSTLHCARTGNVGHFFLILSSAWRIMHQKLEYNAVLILLFTNEKTKTSEN